MHISTSAIYLILLSLLGGSKTAHAEPSEDAFGVSNYGILCQDRIYPKYVIYAAAKNYCDIMKKIPSFGDRTSKGLGFQTRFYYYFSSKTPINNLLKTSHHIVPIFEDGTLYPLGMLYLLFFLERKAFFIVSKISANTYVFSTSFDTSIFALIRIFCKNMTVLH